ncbi:hypothetical protein [Nocardioides sp. YIM 152588]|uniref:hypothetical protein n=1 Tax=Nocardioides sp. YIM 152588 TaxID=3158259 RepID=UPI0032E4CF7E
MPSFDHLTLENRELLDAVHRRDHVLRDAPEKLLVPLFPRCTVRILLVADGGLTFGSADFGLRTLVKTLQGGSTLTTRFLVSIAHRAAPGGDAMLPGDATIANRVTGFRFDDAADFPAGAYDQVWLFGIDSFGDLPDSELRALAQFMDDGGGVFATGDHAALGKRLCGKVPRVRSMRHWDSFDNPDEVSMSGPRRNDTNRRGHDLASTFDDQSDDIPQKIQWTPYSTRVGIFEAVYPHPLLCGPKGVIDVMPDHPHEGECRTPDDLDLDVTFDGQTFTEYPAAVDGGARPEPEVISTSTVLPGTTSSGKAATEGHSFGGICAYDGHRAGVGRVVTDATWHHFININLVGDSGAAFPKNVGFLASAAGQDHLDAIKTYYRNIATWISRPSLIRCMRRRWLWWLVAHSRAIESVATASRVDLREAHVSLLFGIGKHARDVLGRSTSSCQSLRIVLDLIAPHLPTLVRRFDPWDPGPKRPPRGPDPVPWFDPTRYVDIVLGGAVVAMYERLSEASPEEIESGKLDEVMDEALAEGARVALEAARRSAAEAMDELKALGDR